jgi:hypothetical protein
VARGTEQKTGGFCPFSKKLGFVLWGLSGLFFPIFQYGGKSFQFVLWVTAPQYPGEPVQAVVEFPLIGFAIGGLSHPVQGIYHGLVKVAQFVQIGYRYLDIGFVAFGVGM